MTVLILTALALAGAVALAPYLVHRAYRAPRVRERGGPGQIGLPYRAVRIPTVNGKTLFAWLVPPPRARDPAPAVVTLHGWGGNAEQMLPFAALFHREGYAVLLLDARNHGNSDADGFSSLPRFAEDLERGFDWLRGQPGIDPGRLVLLGHSVGAGAALLVAARRREPAAVLSLAAFAHPELLMRRQMRARRIPYRPFGWLILRFIEWTIGARLDDIAPSHSIRSVSCPVLLVHGDADERVPPADARRIFANRPDGRTELCLLPDAGHDSREAIPLHGELLVRFLDRYCIGPGARTASSATSVSDRSL